MSRREEAFRFWSPVCVLALMAVYCGYMLVMAHVKPKVNSPAYDFTKELPARRGAIYSADSTEVPLANSVPAWEYRLDPVALTNAPVRLKKEAPRTKLAIVTSIARALNIDRDRVMEMCENPRKRNQFLSISTDMHAREVLTNRSLVRGVKVNDWQIRTYANDRMLCHVLGGVNGSLNGAAGIEQRYNTRLMGMSGQIQGRLDANKHEIYDKRKLIARPEPGADVYLTVHRGIQHDAETALRDGIREYGASAGWCIVMDSRTGAVLTMASMPDFSPTNYTRLASNDTVKLNRAIGMVYEPGSVMKVITAASAFDAGFATPDTIYHTGKDDPKYLKLPSDGNHDWVYHPRMMTVREAIVHSSNIVIGKLGFDFGPTRLHDYMQRFGFGKCTGIELPGEERGLLKNPKDWDKLSWSRAPIGQFVAVTAIQMASAYQAIANDGLRMRPYIVSRIVSSSGVPVEKHEPQAIGRVISTKAAKTMREVMLDVATPNGTARRAAIRGYTIAGKTGTAQKAKNGHYQDGLYRASFCGIVPSGVVPGHEARLVVLVTLDFDERTQFHQGGNSAAPIFRTIAESAIKYQLVQPDRPEEFLEANE